MLNRRQTASGRSIPRMVATFALIGVGAGWLLTRILPGRTLPSRGPATAPRPAAPQVPYPAEPLWASVAGEEDPGASVDAPPPDRPSDDGRE